MNNITVSEFNGLQYGSIWFLSIGIRLQNSNYRTFTLACIEQHQLDSTSQKKVGLLWSLTYLPDAYLIPILFVILLGISLSRQQSDYRNMLIDLPSNSSSVKGFDLTNRFTSDFFHPLMLISRPLREKCEKCMSIQEQQRERLQCKHCKYEWTRRSAALLFYTSCPRCLYRVNIKKQRIAM